MSSTNIIDLNLHYILRNLTQDNNFLLDTNEIILEKAVCKQPATSIQNLITDTRNTNVCLPAYQTQSYDSLPKYMQNILLPEHYRFGIYHTYEKKMDTINMSFLNALNIAIRPELINADFATHTSAFENFETFITNHVLQNYQIDKTNNTRNKKIINAKLVSDMKTGVIQPQILNFIVNILEINLVIFDMAKSSQTLYWTHSASYPNFNYFRNPVFLVKTDKDYEPIIYPRSLSHDERIKVYANIFNSLSSFTIEPPFTMDVPSMILIHPYISDDTLLYLFNNCASLPNIDKYNELLVNVLQKY